MINHAVRSEFGDREEARTLQNRAFGSRDEGVKRETGEVVARQKALGGEVAIGIEIRTVGCLPALKDLKLPGCIAIPSGCNY